MSPEAWALKKLERLPPPAGLDELGLRVYNEIPDLYGHCASQRSMNKYKRLSRRIELIKQQENDNTTGGTQVPTT